MSKSTSSPPDTDPKLKILQKRMNLELSKGNLVKRNWRLKEIIQPVIQKNLNKNVTLFIEMDNYSHKLKDNLRMQSQIQKKQ
jgi:hypothetical protein